MAYDSIRKLQLVKTDDLWEYALQENSIEAYSDYIRIKGVNDSVVSKLKTLFKNNSLINTNIFHSNGLKITLHKLKDIIYNNKITKRMSVMKISYLSIAIVIMFILFGFQLIGKGSCYSEVHANLECKFNSLMLLLLSHCLKVIFI